MNVNAKLGQANFHIVTRWQFGDTTPGSYRNFPRPVSGLATEFRNFHRSPPVVRSINFFVPVARVPVCNVHSGVLQVHHALGWHLSVYFPMISQRSISLLPRSFFSFSTPFFLLVSVSFFFFSLSRIITRFDEHEAQHTRMHACMRGVYCSERVGGGRGRRRNCPQNSNYPFNVFDCFTRRLSTPLRDFSACRPCVLISRGFPSSRGCLSICKLLRCLTRSLFCKCSFVD